MPSGGGTGGAGRLLRAPPPPVSAAFWPGGPQGRLAAGLELGEGRMARGIGYRGGEEGREGCWGGRQTEGRKVQEEHKPRGAGWRRVEGPASSACPPAFVPQRPAGSPQTRQVVTLRGCGVGLRLLVWSLRAGLRCRPLCFK